MTEAIQRVWHRSTVETRAKKMGIRPEDLIAFVQSEGDKIIEDEKE